MNKRIFPNSSLQMSKIKYIGFDMDATLAIYKSPLHEQLAFDIGKKKLVAMGYPKDLENMEYDEAFPMRGAWFDRKYGNFLKTDEHCNILDAWHGFHKINSTDIRSLYPNKHIVKDDCRIFDLNTVFNVPEIYLLACTVDALERSKDMHRLPNREGFLCGSRQILYKTVQADCRQTIDRLHSAKGEFKKIVSANLPTYMYKDPRAQETLQFLRNSGKTMFLLTNSDWNYTETLMNYVVGDNWQSYFHIVIVDARKPSWFEKHDSFVEINQYTGLPKVGYHSGPLNEGVIYGGGSVGKFREAVGLQGKDTLYCGDHILGDVLCSKSVGAWRTLLVVPELEKEMDTWSSQLMQFERLQELNKHISAKDEKKGVIMKTIAELTISLEQEHGAMGSIMRCGWKPTYYAAMIKRYADLYTGNIYNLMEYDTNHYFHSPLFVLPHEREQEHVDEDDLRTVQRCVSELDMQRTSPNCLNKH